MEIIDHYIKKQWHSTAMLSQAEAPISRSVWEHLIKVYCMLGYLFMFVLFGAFGHLFLDCGGRITAVGYIGTMWWTSRINPSRELRRIVFLMVAALLLGATIGPAINLVLTIDQSDVIKIMMGGFLLFNCYFTATLQSSDRNVIYKVCEFFAPIFITTWIVISETYPNLLAHATLLLLLPLPWYVVLFMYNFTRITLRISFNVPIHLAWISLLCYSFKYPFRDLMLIYMMVLGLLILINMHNQEDIFLTNRGTEDRYYVGTIVTFVAELLARAISIIHTVGITVALTRVILRLRRRRREDLTT